MTVTITFDLGIADPHLLTTSPDQRQHAGATHVPNVSLDVEDGDIVIRLSNPEDAPVEEREEKKPLTARDLLTAFLLMFMRATKKDGNGDDEEKDGSKLDLSRAPSAKSNAPEGRGEVNGRSTGNYDGKGSTKFNSSGMPQLEKYADAYEAAGYITGIDPHIAAAKHMREASGRENVVSKNPDPRNAKGEHDERFKYDVGPSQISRGRVEDEIIPWIKDHPDVAERIKEATGKDVKDLNINDPKHNIVLGQIELLMKTEDAGGDIKKGLYNYQSGGDPRIAAMAPTYVQDILQGAENLRNGRPYTGPGA